MWYLTGSSGVRVIFLVMTALRETIKQMIPCTLNPQPNPITARSSCYLNSITIRGRGCEFPPSFSPEKGSSGDETTQKA